VPSALDGYWYFEQTSVDDVRPSGQPDIPVDVRVVDPPSGEFNRSLYAEVGGPWGWTERLAWSLPQWDRWLSRGVETWVALVDGRPVGYIELDPQPGGTVEIA
jgi:hypothetical protein